MGVLKKAIVTGSEILDFIPQRKPFVFVHSYYGEDQGVFYTGYIPENGTLFTEDGHFAETGIIEHMAQSAAVIVGYGYKSKGENIPVGFIGAVSKFELFTMPLVGEELYTGTRIMAKFGDISLVECTISSNDVKVASGELKIFLQK
ncbi:MAG: hydroxymyristoyl-ACP dehydratase [Bacteroidales bacterium]|nr:hydroxymyristoyl-ACP dehydratase [Bacteroidales bacterium]